MSELEVFILVFLSLCCVFLFEYVKKIVISKYYNNIISSGKLKVKKNGGGIVDSELVCINIGMSNYYFICLTTGVRDMDLAHDFLYKNQNISKQINKYKPIYNINLTKSLFFPSSLKFVAYTNEKELKKVISDVFKVKCGDIDLSANTVLYQFDNKITLRIAIGLRNLVFFKRTSFLKRLLHEKI